ncbi:MAG: COX15/CtaA family protein [Myxococcota bacterium]
MASETHRSDPSFARAAWAFLGYTLLVIVWGAVVRATLHGDGCGDHWPLCNGEIVPAAKTTKTLVEFTHRLTSGVAFLGALALFVAARRRFPEGHAARRAARWGFVFMTTEAIIGAGLVLLKMVADNRDVARGWWAAGHLGNTFLLLAALALTAHAAGGGRLPRLRGARGAKLAVALLGVLLLGASGAIVALGDTLFPAATLAEGIAQDFDPESHLFVRLRTLHPILGLAVALGTLFFTTQLAAAEPELRRLALGIAGVFVAQTALGFLNVALLAPLWAQLAHLLLADALWIGLVLLAARACPAPDGATLAPPRDPVPALG